MPIFEYHCNACGSEFEKLVKSKDAEISCAECGSKDVKKKVSKFGFKSGGHFTSSIGSSGCDSCGSKHSSACKSCK